MTSLMDTVSAYYQAMGAKDWDKVGTLLAPNFTFRGSLASFDGPSEYIEGVSSMPFEGAPADSSFIADGARVAHTFVWKVTAPVKVDIPMCEVLEVSGSKIVSSKLFYDSKLFPEMN